MTYINKQWLLDQRPKGMPGDECWKLNEEEVRPLEKGEVLIKILYLSIDPYMRGRMNDGESYADPAALGEPMTGESVGILPGGGGTQRLSRLIGSSRALDLILHAKLLKPLEAYNLGI